MQLKVRNVTEDDCHDLWLWRNHQDVRKWSFDKTEISYNIHRKWFHSKINNKKVTLYIAENEKNEKLGQVRFEILDENQSEIHINLNPQYFGQNLGHKIIKSASEVFLKENKTIKQIIAVTLEKNIASQKAFEKAGYENLKTGNKHSQIVKIYVSR